MLTNLKGKLLNRIKKSNEEPPEPPQIDLDAGAEILTHFQSQWEELHQINEENALNASKVAQVIDSLHVKISKEHRDVCEMHHLLVGTRFDKIFENCQLQIQNMYQSFKSVEEGLVQLENLIEEEQFRKRMIDHKKQLQSYEESKTANYEKLKLDLMQKYKASVMCEEDKKRKMLLERQQVFEEAFNNDLLTYKSCGSLPKIETKGQPSALLEEIQLDLDQNDLEQFLEEN